MRLTITHGIPLVMSLAISIPPGCGGDDDDDDDGGPDSAEHEPNDSAQQAREVSVGDQIFGSMAPGDEDYFLLEVPADYASYKLTVAVEDDRGDCFTGTDPNLEVLASDGRTRLYWKEDSVADYCPALSFVPDPGGKYYLVVGTAVDLSGDYTLTLSAGGSGTVSGSVSSGGVALSATAPIDAADRPVVSGRIPVMDGELLLRLAPGMSALELEPRLSHALGVPLKRQHALMSGRYHLLRADLPGGLDGRQRREATLELVQRARALPWVLEVEPNRVFSGASTPNDTYFSDQWDFMSWPGMNAVGAWDDFQGSRDAITAVIDTGNDATHPDLQGQFVPGYDFISNPESAGDGDGFDSDPDDALGNGHGTHVSGTIAAKTDNNQGVAGVSWSSLYMPLRVCGNYGCTEADIIEAIWHAAGFETAAGPGETERRADVINMSLSGNDLCDNAIGSVIAAAAQRGVIVVAAAGNDGSDAAWFSPANCPSVITVGATDNGGQRASFSNFGDSVDVMAPGVSTYSTYYGSNYAALSGTSMASPHVAGLAALLKGVNPTFSFEHVLELMQDHGAVVDCAGAADGCGAGIIDAGASVSDAFDDPDDAPAAPVLVRATNTADPSKVFYTTVVDGLFIIDGLPAGSYQIDAGEDLDGDFALDEAGEAFGAASGTFSITDNGEDLDGVSITLE